MRLPYAIFIAGPTASGKTSLALDVVARLVDAGALPDRSAALVINADSMQVYDTLRVLSARPGRHEMGEVPHRMFGVLSPGQAFSVAEWVDMAMQEVSDAHEAGRLPIMVGGTGLYFKALLGGLAVVPDIPDDIRAHVRDQQAQLGAHALHGLLSAEDPIMSERLEEGDSQRIARALEVIRATGISLADWQENTKPGPLYERDQAGEIMKYVLERPRQELYARIEARFDQMVDEGALDEVQALMAQGIEENLPAMKALGVPSLMAYLRGEMPLDDALADAKTRTRRYAKRQITWFSNQFGDWPRIDVSSGQGADVVVAKILANQI